MSETRRKKKSGKRALYIVAFVLIVVGIILSLTVLFSIDSIEVVGDSGYDEKAIIDASGIAIGGNLFRFSKNRREQAIVDKLVEIDTAEITRKLPDTVIISVTRCVGAASIQTENGWALISVYGKVMSSTANRVKGCPVVLGMNVPAQTTGAQFVAGDEVSYSLYCDIVEQLDLHGLLSRVGLFDISDRLNIKLVCDDRVLVMLGTGSSLESKFELLMTVYSRPENEGLEGYIDVSQLSEVRVLQDKGLLSEEYPDYFAD